MNKLIGLYSSCPQCGKTTLANLLDHEKMSFAAPLREILNVLLTRLGYNGEMIDRFLHGDLKEFTIPELGNRSPRYLMQTLGTEWGRYLVSETIWVDVMRARIRHAFSPVVIDDVRFPNEFDMIRSLGGLMVKIDRPGFKKCGLHPSDGGCDHLAFDVYITNDGRPEDMLEQLKEWRGQTCPK